MKVAFKNESFAFEFVRNLGFMYYGGADLGEMMATVGQIKEGDSRHHSRRGFRTSDCDSAAIQSRAAGADTDDTGRTLRRSMR